ncbi:14379_t:CDS:2 [Acaulospora morrowiae]|uniref:14379_t:CDS:1 n=1 Tax=Acaulospora morrowiae TaxID=94023 RepID=A0A9N9BDN7_9GLOM|nr:14379_t:CDS:2 [Acaulospora morrowiae]
MARTQILTPFLKHILIHLEPEDVARCAQVSRSWRDASYSDSLWRRWKYWKSKPKKTDGWRQIYLARITTDRWAFAILDELAASGPFYLANMKKLRQLGDNCRDVLLWVMDNPNETTLTHCYFAKRALQFIRRSEIIQKWKAWRNYELELSNLEGFAMMATFFNERIDVEEILREIDELAMEFNTWCMNDPPDSQLTKFRRLAEFFSVKYPSTASVLEIETKFLYLVAPLLETKQSKACVMTILFEALTAKVGIENVDIVSDREKLTFRRYHFVRFRDEENSSANLMDHDSKSDINSDEEELGVDIYHIDFKKHSETGVLTVEQFDRHSSKFYGAYTPEYKFIPQQKLFRLFLQDYWIALTSIRGYNRDIIYGTALQLHFVRSPEYLDCTLGDLCKLMNFWWSFVAARYRYPEDYELGRMALADISNYIAGGTPLEQDMWQRLAEDVNEDIEGLEEDDCADWDFESGQSLRGQFGKKDPKFYIGDVVNFKKFHSLGVICRWDRVYNSELAGNVAKFVWTDIESPRNEPFYEVLTHRGSFIYCGQRTLILEPLNSERLSRMVPANVYGDFLGDEADWELAKALGPVTTELVGCYFERWDQESCKYIPNEVTSRWFPDG